MDSGSGSDEPGPSGSSSVPAISGATYIIPETEQAVLSHRGVASLWEQGARAENQQSKRQKTADVDAVQECPSTLTVLQQQVLHRVVERLDTRNTSIVITNPLVRDNPIVFVTEPWQKMCGFSSQEAIGRNPRLTQGSQSDSSAIMEIAHNVRQQRACKVLVLNFRGGHEANPFWNMLSISPVHHRGQLMLYMANLQDYSYSLGKMVSLSPSQFCRSADFHQRQRYVADLRSEQPLLLARPTIYEADGESALTNAADDAPSAPHPAALKRLGWDRLTLEPECLMSTVVDALQRLDAQYELSESRGHERDEFLAHARINGIAMRVSVSDDAQPGAYRIACTRMGGDTFAYHDAYRRLRDLLSDDGFVSWRSPMPRLTVSAPQEQQALQGPQQPPAPPQPQELQEPQELGGAGSA